MLFSHRSLAALSFRRTYSMVRKRMHISSAHQRASAKMRHALRIKWAILPALDERQMAATISEYGCRDLAESPASDQRRL
jgi:hypothetical protein